MAGHDSVREYREQSQAFLDRAWQYLDRGDLLQASEKGWGAAAWMAKAVAEANGWEYLRHNQFNVVLNNARNMTGHSNLSRLREVANELHRNFYTPRRLLVSEEVRLALHDVSELLAILDPLTHLAET